MLLVFFFLNGDFKYKRPVVSRGKIICVSSNRAYASLQDTYVRSSRAPKISHKIGKRGEFIATLHGDRALIGTTAAISSSGKCLFARTPSNCIILT